MSSPFYGKDTTDPGPELAPLKTFRYTVDSIRDPERELKAHHVFFYESGHVGFWIDQKDGGRTLVLGVKALTVWEDTKA